MRGQRGSRAYRYRPGGQSHTGVRAAKIWREIVQKERAQLYCTPERVAEIERRQPEALERGRALFYRPGTVTGTVKQCTGESPVLEEEREVVVPAWRKTFEFTGDEGALADEIDEEEAEDLRTEVVAA
jgi:hypothetical protein